jgi:iron-sulfur cluster assembly protein
MGSGAADAGQSQKVSLGSVRAPRVRVMYSAVDGTVLEGLKHMAIVLTESAADRVRSHLQKRGAGLGLRVGIKRTGCSGFAYVVNYADEISPKDAVFEAQGVKVVVDRDSLPLIDGTVVDFVKQGLNEAFKFQNPKAKGECGCGESFSV